MSFVLQAFGILFTILTFFFLGKLVDAAKASSMMNVKGGYFTFVLIGIAVSNYMSVASRGYADRLREAQLTGTLEAMMMTPTPVGQIVVFSTIYDFLFASLRVAVYIGIGAAFFGLDVSNARWGWALLFLLVSIIAFSSIGIISAAFIMIFKRGDPLAMLLNAVSFLFSGVYYPVEVLPGWLQWVSAALPMTWALRGLRAAISSTGDSGDLLTQALVLVLFAAVLWPVSLAFFSLAVRKARKDGTLGKF